MVSDYNRPRIMGILNVTPDSFSDGGKYTDIDSALNHAETMLAQGADILDIGAESTRPGSSRVADQEQVERLVPVIKAIRQHIQEPIEISVDTCSSKVAEAGLDAGATMINDISAGLFDENILYLCAERNTPIILMHMRGTPKTMQDNPDYESVVDDVLNFLQERIDAALSAGIKKEQIAIDPGIGFGKRKQDNIDLLANLARFVDTGFPVLLGTSRKRFMGDICDVSEPSQLVTATAVTTALGVMAGVQMFRVHDVRENRQAAEVALAIKQSGSCAGQKSKTAPD